MKEARGASFIQPLARVPTFADDSGLLSDNPTSGAGASSISPAPLPRTCSTQHVLVLAQNFWDVAAPAGRDRRVILVVRAPDDVSAYSGQRVMVRCTARCTLHDLVVRVLHAVRNRPSVHVAHHGMSCTGASHRGGSSAIRHRCIQGFISVQIEPRHICVPSSNHVGSC